MSLQRNLIVLIFSCVALTLANNQVTHELSLLTFMSRSNDALQNNPQRSMECFEYYIPLINEIAQTYENDFKACITASEAAQSAAETATADDREALATTFYGSCSNLSKCTDKKSATDVYQCYIIEASEGAKSLYGVSNEATVQLAALQESIRRIQSEENVCTTQTKIQYETQSTQAYADFNSCILGNSPVPTTTVAPTTVEPTTAAPTTVEPTTAEPTTEEPVETTTVDSPAPTDGPVDAPIDVKPEEDLFRFIRRLNRFRV